MAAFSPTIVPTYDVCTAAPLFRVGPFERLGQDLGRSLDVAFGTIARAVRNVFGFGPLPVSLADHTGPAWGLGRVPVKLRAVAPVLRRPVTFSGLRSRRPIRSVRRESRGPSWRGRRMALRRRERL